MAWSPGFTEQIKRSVIKALRAGIDIDLPTDDPLFTVKDNISFEYPADILSYPGIWVNFSFSQLQKLSIDPVFETDTQRKYLKWSFEGRATLSIVALTSLERDRISDAMVKLFAFNQYSPGGADFWTQLTSLPGIEWSVNKDQFFPGGQTVSVGAPWQNDLLVYEDSYSFNLFGQFNSDIQTGSLVIVNQVNILPDLFTVPLHPGIDPPPIDGNGTWE